MITEFLNFLDKHLGTLAGWDLGIVLLFVAVVYAIYKFTPIASEWVKQRKVVTERRKGMNGNSEFEDLKRRVDNDREKNQEEHNDLYKKVEAVQEDVVEIKESVAYIRGKLSKDE